MDGEDESKRGEKGRRKGRRRGKRAQVKSPAERLE